MNCLQLYLEDTVNSFFKKNFIGEAGRFDSATAENELDFVFEHVIESINIKYQKSIIDIGPTCTA